jgi:7-carboxy-7-deazaguanine synthase
VVETFHSLQGEGLQAGRSAFFIRLGGCEVGCSWCDTKQSWPKDVHPQLSLEALGKEAQQAATAGAAFVVITGGEPLEHNLTALCAALQPIDVPLHLETSGVGKLTGSFAWITLSPKPHRPPEPEVLTACDELKVVVYHPSDLSFAEEHAALVNKNCEGRLQPEWSKASERLPELIDYIKSNPYWKISLQTHKFMDIP